MPVEAGPNGTEILTGGSVPLQMQQGDPNLQLVRNANGPANAVSAYGAPSSASAAISTPQLPISPANYGVSGMTGQPISQLQSAAATGRDYSGSMTPGGAPVGSQTGYAGGALTLPGQAGTGSQGTYVGGALTPPAMAPPGYANPLSQSGGTSGAMTLPGQVQPATGNAAMAVASPAGQQGQAQQATTPAATNQAASTNQVAPQYRGLTRSNMANQQTQGSYTPGQNYLSQYYKQLRGSLPQNGFGTRF